jgi:hypothetical protein
LTVLYIQVLLYLHSRRIKKASCTNKTDRYDKTEILLKVLFTTITLTLTRIKQKFICIFTIYCIYKQSDWPKRAITCIYHIIKYSWHRVAHLWPVMCFLISPMPRHISKNLIRLVWLLTTSWTLLIWIHVKIPQALISYIYLFTIYVYP